RSGGGAESPRPPTAFPLSVAPARLDRGDPPGPEPRPRPIPYAERTRPRESINRRRHPDCHLGSDHRAGRRGDVAAQRPATQTAEEEIQLRADRRVARPRHEGLGTLQQRRLRRGCLHPPTHRHPPPPPRPLPPEGHPPRPSIF